MEQEQRQQHDHASNRASSKENSHKEQELSPMVLTEAGEDEDELSGLDPIDDVVGTLGPAIEDGDADRVGWEREASYAQNGMEAGFSGAVLVEDATRNHQSSSSSSRKQHATVDDSSSTCSSDSLPSVRTAMNESFVARSNMPEQSHINPNRCVSCSDHLRPSLWSAARALAATDDCSLCVILSQVP